MSILCILDMVQRSHVTYINIVICIYQKITLRIRLDNNIGYLCFSTEFRDTLKAIKSSPLIDKSVGDWNSLIDLFLTGKWLGCFVHTGPLEDCSQALQL